MDPPLQQMLSKVVDSNSQLQLELQQRQAEREQQRLRDAHLAAAQTVR